MFGSALFSLSLVVRERDCSVDLSPFISVQHYSCYLLFLFSEVQDRLFLLVIFLFVVFFLIVLLLVILLLLLLLLILLVGLWVLKRESRK